MLQRIFNTELKLAYEACKSALKEYKCEEVYGDFSAGIIQALKKSNFLNEEKICIQMNHQSGVVISISVNTNDDPSNLWNAELMQLQESMVLELISLKLT